MYHFGERWCWSARNLWVAVAWRCGRQHNSKGRVCCLVCSPPFMGDMQMEQLGNFATICVQQNGDKTLPKKADAAKIMGHVEEVGGINLVWY